jgi:ATP-binding cassette subfamily C (CFTR/MRP) protein 1
MLQSNKKKDSWDSEAPPPKEWPHEGNITFKNFSLKYRNELDNVLEDINAQIVSGEKIGIVGRTGIFMSQII